MEDRAKQAEVRDPSEVNKEWIDSWNKNDTNMLDSLTASDAVLYMQGKSMNTDSIRAWCNMVAPMMKDLKTNSEVKYSGEILAYEAGTYSHQIKGDSLNNTYEGAYTFIWKKIENDWKLQVMNITDKTPDSTSTEIENK